ncbi:unnamed protein product [Durusdinium trenchii]|uniref:Uncharacterized protein n=1 Tax=Durusdinium trenchii TaxID=1381693 RepID=A0ABP0LMN8_9DINO
MFLGCLSLDILALVLDFLQPGMFLLTKSYARAGFATSILNTQRPGIFPSLRSLARADLPLSLSKFALGTNLFAPDCVCVGPFLPLKAFSRSEPFLLPFGKAVLGLPMTIIDSAKSDFVLTLRSFAHLGTLLALFSGNMDLLLPPLDYSCLGPAPPLRSSS